MCIYSFFSKVFRRKKKLIGKVKVTRQEYAYVIPEKDSSNDILVFKDKLNYALDGDTVEVVYYPIKNNEGKYVGYVKKILKRAHTVCYGTLDKRLNGYTFNISSFKNFYNVIVLDTNSINCRLFPSRAEAKIINYPSKNSSLECVITNVIGPFADDSVEFRLILKTYNINDKFPDNVLLEADSLAMNIKNITKLNNRTDFRKEFTFTIDPKNSKDFDDAISITKLENGNYRLGIHIADVSHYVREGSALDIEAYKRNTSAYFIDKVIPMLPDVLCNNICSLLPNEDRLTFSVVLEIDNDFNIVSTKICESIIHSDLRLTYEEAQVILENGVNTHRDEFVFLLSFAKMLKKRRIEDGTIDFNYYNFNYNLDNDNNLVVEVVKCSDSHMLIEELMILANRTVAEYVATKINGTEKKAPVFLYRVHPKPEKWKVIDFCKLMNSFNIFLDPNSSNFRSELNNVITGINDDNIEWIVSISSIKMMQKAYYSTVPIGHYGLAIDYYSHFTSPIRRYSDIVVHRLLKKYINRNFEYDSTKYDKICEYSLERERSVVDAEREYLKFKQVKTLEKYEGVKLEGIVYSVTEFGIFVELCNLKCIGLVRFTNIDVDSYVYDSESKHAYSKISGNILRIGDKVSVVLNKVDLENRLIDLSLF